jgi:hypothetical protein
MGKGKGELTIKEAGSLGGKQRAKNLSAARRKEIAKKAAAARWPKKGGKQ